MKVLRLYDLINDKETKYDNALIRKYTQSYSSLLIDCFIFQEMPLSIMH